MKAQLKILGKSIIIDELKKCNAFERLIGLMFKRKEKANALLFDFQEEGRMAIHSFFVFFPFLAIWLNKDNKVVENRIIYPFAPIVLPCRDFSQLIEIPMNEKYKNIFSLLQNYRRK